MYAWPWWWLSRNFVNNPAKIIKLSCKMKFPGWQVCARPSESCTLPIGHVNNSEVRTLLRQVYGNAYACACKKVPGRSLCGLNRLRTQAPQPVATHFHPGKSQDTNTRKDNFVCLLYYLRYYRWNGGLKRRQWFVKLTIIKSSLAQFHCCSWLLLRVGNGGQ